MNLLKIEEMNRIETTKFPLVSIVTPSYNAIPYIKDNIESVLVQKYPNLEHIVMDGGSKDGTVDVLKSYNHLSWI